MSFEIQKRIKEQAPKIFALRMTKRDTPKDKTCTLKDEILYLTKNAGSESNEVTFVQSAMLTQDLYASYDDTGTTSSTDV